jgi:chromosome segregation ATPase
VKDPGFSVLDAIRYRLHLRDVGISGPATFTEHAAGDIETLLQLLEAAQQDAEEARRDVAVAEAVANRADGLQVQTEAELEKLQVEIGRLRWDLAAAKRDRDAAEARLEELDDRPDS